MKIFEIKNKIGRGELDSALISLCSVNEGKIETERSRYIKAADEFVSVYGDMDGIRLFSVGGRSEISGNHTDHNYGRVIAASVNLLAVVAPTNDGKVCIKSAGFPEDIVEEGKCAEPDESLFFTSASIIAGMQKAFLNAGYNIGGFRAYTTSNVLKGSGISSSAAFEVMVGNILNHLYNDGKVSNVEIAKMAQFAENKYFGKPCGLMDQTACAVGGFITIDFADPTSPIIESLDFDLTKEGYSLCIVNTGGNHADLNEDYASVPSEMKSVAKVLGREVLRGTTNYDLVSSATRIREKCGDRALLRAFHFVNENERVDAQVKALKSGDLDAFFAGVTSSGNSSFKFLQNVYTTKNVSEQGLSCTLYHRKLYCRQEVSLQSARRRICRYNSGIHSFRVHRRIQNTYGQRIR